VKAVAKSKWIPRDAVTDAGVRDSQKLAELVVVPDGAGYADRGGEAEGLLAHKPVTSRIQERAYRSRPLSDGPEAGKRQQSRLGARRLKRDDKTSNDRNPINHGQSNFKQPQQQQRP